jgi:hypothetical protein
MIKKIIRWFWNLIYGELDDAEVKAFYDKFANVFELSNYLMANGYEWASDGTNTLPYYKFDDFSRPGQVIARRFGNCSDFLRLFSEFVKYKRCADRLEECLLHNGPIGAWHYVSLIQDRGITYIQSNMSVNILDKPLLELYKGKYSKMELIDTWEK